MAKLFGAQRMVLQAINDSPKDAAGYVADTQVAQSTQIALKDVQDWFKTLEAKGLIDIARTRAGLKGLIKAEGRLVLSDSVETPPPPGETNNPGSTLSPEAMMLLDEANSSGEKAIEAGYTAQDDPEDEEEYEVVIGDFAYSESEGDPRLTASLQDVMDSLTRAGMVRRSPKRESEYRVTARGYQALDEYKKERHTTLTCDSNLFSIASHDWHYEKHDNIYALLERMASDSKRESPISHIDCSVACDIANMHNDPISLYKLALVFIGNVQNQTLFRLEPSSIEIEKRGRFARKLDRKKLIVKANGSLTVRIAARITNSVRSNALTPNPVELFEFCSEVFFECKTSKAFPVRLRIVTLKT
jgi:hypothetical protein